MELLARWTWLDNGKIGVWLNGTRVVNYSGGTSFNDGTAPYPKAGQYCFSMNPNKNYSDRADSAEIHIKEVLYGRFNGNVSF